MKVTKIVLFLQPLTNLLDFGGIVQVFTEAQEMGVKIDLIICAESEKISTITDISFTNIQHYTKVQLSKNDLIIILSSHHGYIFSKTFSPSKSVLNWLTRNLKMGVKIVAVCNGAFLLGKAGLLDGKNCTTHWKRTTQLKNMYPKAKVIENRLFVEDENIITSAGSASGIDLALHIVSSVSDDYHCHKVARELVVFNRREGGSTQHSAFLQFRNHFHNGIHLVQDYIINNIQCKQSISQLAEVANMSERNFCRVFKRETSITVFEFISNIRYVIIHELIKNPDLNKTQIANRVGLESDRQVNRILKNAWQDMS